MRRLNLRARVGENLAHRGKIGKLAYNKIKLQKFIDSDGTPYSGLTDYES